MFALKSHIKPRNLLINQTLNYSLVERLINVYAIIQEGTYLMNVGTSSSITYRGVQIGCNLIDVFVLQPVMTLNYTTSRSEQAI